MSDKKRLDQILVEKKLVESRNRARDLIESGAVSIILNGVRVKALKASQSVDSQIRIEIEKSELNKYVSRGGLKLAGALDETKTDVQGFKVLDVGLSTGGFADCLLQRGAALVIGVDVGKNQTHPDLLRNSKLKIFENINARHLNQDLHFMQAMPQSGFDLIVMDVSFISITLIMPALCEILKKDQLLLSLVKPQFEVGREGLGKGGIVKDASLFIELESKLKVLCTELGLDVLNYFASSIEGKDGNKEFFIFARKK